MMCSESPGDGVALRVLVCVANKLRADGKGAMALKGKGAEGELQGGAKHLQTGTAASHRKTAPRANAHCGGVMISFVCRVQVLASLRLTWSEMGQVPARPSGNAGLASDWHHVIITPIASTKSDLLLLRGRFCFPVPMLCAFPSCACS